MKTSLKIIFILLSCLFDNHYLFSQQENDYPIEFDNINIKGALVGSIFYPGVTFGLEKQIKGSLDKREKKGILHIKRIEQYLTAETYWYHHPNFHDNYYLTLNWMKRKTRENGLFFDFTSGAGYSKTFLGSVTYEVGDDVVNIKNNAGNSYFLLNISNSIGYDFKYRQLNSWKLYFRANLIVMLPYNSFIYPRPVWEIGTMYGLKTQ